MKYKIYKTKSDLPHTSILQLDLIVGSSRTYQIILEGYVVVDDDNISPDDVLFIQDNNVSNIRITDNSQKRNITISIANNDRYQRIPRIKELRNATRWGLKEAKEYDDELVKCYPHSLTFEDHSNINDVSIKRLENVGYCVIVKNRDVLPDDLFQI